MRDESWRNISKDIENQMARAFSAYSAPESQRSYATPELAAFVNTLNEIFSQLPRNAPVSTRVSLEGFYRQFLMLTTRGRDIKFVDKPGSAGGRQRKLPGT